jgi:hypothetical protein
VNRRRYFLSSNGETWVEVTGEENWFTTEAGKAGFVWSGYGLPVDDGTVIELVPAPGSTSIEETWVQFQKDFAKVQVAADHGYPYRVDHDKVAALMERLIESWPPSPADTGAAAGYLMMLMSECNQLQQVVDREW